MIQLPLAGKIEHAARCTRLVIVSTEHQSANPRLNQCADTHRARFQCHVKRRVYQSVIARSVTRRPQRDNFGMRGWIVIRYRSIAAASNDLTANNNHRSYRYLILICPKLGLCKRRAHELHVLVSPASTHCANTGYSHSMVAGGLPEMS